MSENEGSAPAPETTTVADVPAEGATTDAVAGSPPAADDHGLSDAEVAELAGQKHLNAAPPTDEPTVDIGGVAVPVSALADLPDDVLRHIRRKVRAAGEEREVSMLDALDAVPKAAGWQKRQWQAAQKEKELKAAAQALPTNAIEAVMRLRNVDRREATDILAQQLVAELEEAQLPQEERQHRQRMRELEERAARADEYERAEQEKQQAAQVAKARESYLQGIGGALKSAGIPSSQYVIGRMAMVLQGAFDAGVIQGDPTAEDYRFAAQQVSSELAEERKAYVGDADGDDLIERLGPELARKVARAYAKRVQGGQKPPERSPESTPSARQETQREMSWEEYWEAANKRMGIG